jgi:hypothetical protein
MIASQLSEPLLGSGIAEIRLAGMTAALRLSLRTVLGAGNADIETPKRPAPAPPGPVLWVSNFAQPCIRQRRIVSYLPP